MRMIDWPTVDPLRRLDATHAGDQQIGVVEARCDGCGTVRHFEGPLTGFDIPWCDCGSPAMILDIGSRPGARWEAWG